MIQRLGRGTKNQVDRPLEASKPKRNCQVILLDYYNKSFNSQHSKRPSHLVTPKDSRDATPVMQHLPPCSSPICCNRKERKMLYCTFYSRKTPKQITFEDLLNNPFMTLAEIPQEEQKKVTIAITEEYGKQLAEKRNLPTATSIYDDVIKELKTEEHYRHFEIPKKSDPKKKRPIDAPDDLVSGIQTYYKNYIEQYLRVLPHKAAHAYVEKRGTLTAMQQHQKNESKWFLQIDLKNFFNSITGTWLKEMLLKVYPFPYIDETTLDNIVKVSLLNGALPQGSHLSPTLTNIIMVPIDYAITEKLHNYRKHHYVYTRYADDITISCKYKFNPKEIENVIREIFRDFNVPFHINEDKTRFGSSSGRNYHVGLILNKDNKISLGHEKNNKFRAMLFNFCTTGYEWELKDVYRMLGLISYYKSIEPDFVSKTLDKYNKKFNIDILTTAKNMTSSSSFEEITFAPQNNDPKYELPF